MVDFFLELLKQNVHWGTFAFDVAEDKLDELRTIFLDTILNKDKITEIKAIAELIMEVCEPMQNGNYVEIVKGKVVASETDVFDLQ